MQLDFIKCHGSGNDFPMIDARALRLTDGQWAAIARALADRAGPVGGDGLLALTEGDADHAFGFRMWNADGSEAETCLNGLRCVARLGLERLGLEDARVRLRTSSAEVARAAPIAPGVATIRETAGPASMRTADVGLHVAVAEIVDSEVPGLPSRGRFTAVAMPNPHLVRFVETVDEGELVALGRWCEAAPPLLPGRGNISFVEVRGEALFVRTFERGVGLTNSCGSAMAASVFAAGRTGRVPFGREIRVLNKGGLVRARAEADGMVTVLGNATFEWEGRIAVDPESGAVGALAVTRERAEEAAAWAAVAGAAG
jgi:diaminopimelate epimerase